MTTFTDEQARQQLDSILKAAQHQGEVRIRTNDGREYAVRPVPVPTATASPFDIPGVDLHLSAAEIVQAIRDGRER